MTQRNLEARLRSLEARTRWNRNRSRWQWVNFLTKSERDKLRGIVKRLIDIAPENPTSALTSEERVWLEEAMNRKAKPVIGAP